MITVEDVLRIFPGAKVVDDRKDSVRCEHCGGPIIKARWPHKIVLQCHYCGREYDGQ
jgi:hypothetical protein